MKSHLLIILILFHWTLLYEEVTTHTLSSQDDNKWHVAMFLKFVNVTKLQFLFPWQVSWHSLTDEIFINVFTTASPDGLHRKELKTHWFGRADELILVFSVFSWHRTWCDPKTIVTNKHNGNMLGFDLNRFTSLPSKKLKP